MSKYKNPACTVDALLLRKRDKVFDLLVIKRKKDPFAGQYALPGGFVDYGEDPEKAVLRELTEETGLDTDGAQVTLSSVHGNAERDPRGHTISIAYAVKLTHNDYDKIQGSDDAESAEWIEVKKFQNKTEQLAFDHQSIVDHFMSWFQNGSPSGQDQGYFMTSK
ncbi:hypothetical protein MP228_011906 [Amoeboaphelidium protococcarum]|nr:hypothetical protein MP228_011906 [Amoeboaphelidium protococcarum]